MKHVVKHIHFVGMASLSREQGSLWDASGCEGCRMSTTHSKFRGTAR